MPKDLVCLMEIDEDVVFKVEYNKRAYYFCSRFCLEKFIKNPGNYLDRHKDSLDKPEP